MEALLRTIRESCSANTWSKGVMLVRAGAVSPSRSTKQCVEVQVSTHGSVIAQTVSLYPEDEDWVCECDSPEDACAHVAAAVIAVRQARKDGAAAPIASVVPKATVGYRLEGNKGKLQLRRVVVRGTDEAPLFTSLTAAAAANEGPSIAASRQDIDIENACGSFTGGTIPAPLLPRIFEALIDVADLKLGRQSVRITEPTCGLAAHIDDCAAGYRLRLIQDPDVSEVFENGALRSGNDLSAVSAHGINERLFASLRREKIYPRSEAGELVGEVLPLLEKTVRLVVDSATLPHADRMPVRIEVRTSRDDNTLTTRAQLVYGDPPCARVEQDSLTLLGGKTVPRRNHHEEQRLRQTLREGLGIEVGEATHFEGRAALEFAARLAAFDDPRAIRPADVSGQFHVTAPLEARMQVDGSGRVDVWFAPVDGPSPDGQQRRAEPGAVLKAWQRGDEHAPLLDGGFGALPADWLQRFGPRLQDLLATREAMRAGSASDDAALPPFAFGDIAALCEATGQDVPTDLRRLEALARDFSGIPNAALPKDLKATLRDYQRDGINWLSFLRDAQLGALLADDMGLGKTLQALCAIRGKALVIAPRSVLHNWENEIRRFRPGLSAHTYHGPSRVFDTEADVTLTTYAVLRLDIEKLCNIRWDTVVLDESQAIKNPTSQVTRAAHRIDAAFRIALTGTPVENRLDDLWSQFQFINPGLLGSRSSFQERYARPIESGDSEAAARLRERLRPFILRRHKKEVAPELPPRTELVLSCELDETERQIYDAVRASTRDEVTKKLAGGANALAILEALLRLRQAACHPALVPGQGAFADRDSSKVRLLLETLDEAVAEGHKALVFSQWTSLLDRVEPSLRRAGLEFIRLDGSTRDRGAVVDSFQSDDGPSVMLLSLKAGGTGLNLTAADHVFLLDPWWNPAVEDQAADRAHRIGQDKPVFIHRLIAEGTVEERILALQARKRDLAHTAVGDATAANTITREDLLALLQ